MDCCFFCGCLWLFWWVCDVWGVLCKCRRALCLGMRRNWGVYLNSLYLSGDRWSRWMEWSVLLKRWWIECTVQNRSVSSRWQWWLVRSHVFKTNIYILYIFIYYYYYIYDFNFTNMFLLIKFDGLTYYHAIWNEMSELMSKWIQLIQIYYLFYLLINCNVRHRKNKSIFPIILYYVQWFWWM